MTVSSNGSEGFPAGLEIDYPDRELNRLTTALRLVTVIPIAVILVLIGGPQSGGGQSHHAPALAGGGLVFLPTVLLLVFTHRYPRWWFEWNLQLTRFGARVAAYLALLRDEYPSVEDEQAVHLTVAYPDPPQNLSRWLPLVKWFLAIPHYIALAFLGIAAFCCVVIAWFAILFTGRCPRSLFEFVVGVLRWMLRVAAYAFLLTTDRYPPFGVSA